MKLSHFILLAGVTLTAPAISHAQVAGSTLLGVSVQSCVTLRLVGAPNAKFSGRR